MANTELERAQAERDAAWLGQRMRQAQFEKMGDLADRAIAQRDALIDAANNVIEASHALDGGEHLASWPYEIGLRAAISALKDAVEMGAARSPEPPKD